jgi:hypothetical protein
LASDRGSAVVDLASRRRLPDGDDFICLECGGSWFKLEPAPHLAVVTIAQGGRITGYHGIPVCAECGRRAVELAR